MLKAFSVQRDFLPGTPTAGLPISYLSPLQRIQNTAARMITLTRKHDHMSPILRSLYTLATSPFSYYF